MKPLSPEIQYIHGRTRCAGLRWLRQRGFTLVELSVSMAIAAILVVSALAVLRQQLDQAQVASSSYFLQQAMVSLQDFFSGDNNTAAINNGVLVNSGAVARDYVGNGGGTTAPIANTWGGQLFIGPLLPDVNSDWVLQVSGLPMRLCADIVQSLESTLTTTGVRHTLAGQGIAATEIGTPALGAVTLVNNVLSAALPNVNVLKNSPYTPLNPAALGTLCETSQPYFNLFLTGRKNAL
ncbi:type II secretion system protein [Herbaspirillum seropedicae]|uniref:type II secretion system protein n=1 Tax=Herbaspirillum seropedicae TaxID=964 RepID=UPI003D959D00